MEKRRNQSLYFWSNFDPSFRPEDGQNSLNFPGKMRLLSSVFGISLPENRAGSQVKGVESKFDKYYFIHTIPGQLSVKDF